MLLYCNILYSTTTTPRARSMSECEACIAMRSDRVRPQGLAWSSSSSLRERSLYALQAEAKKTIQILAILAFPKGPHLKVLNPKRPSYHRGWWHIVLVLEPSVTFTENWLADRDIGSALGLLQPWQAEILWRSLPWHLRLRAFFGHALFRLQALQAAARKLQERGSRR